MSLNELLDEAIKIYGAMQQSRWLASFRIQKLHLLDGLRQKEKPISDDELADNILKKFEQLYPVVNNKVNEAKQDEAIVTKEEKIANEKMKSVFTLLKSCAICITLLRRNPQANHLSIQENSDLLLDDLDKLIHIHAEDPDFSYNLTKLTVKAGKFIRSLSSKQATVDRTLLEEKLVKSEDKLKKSEKDLETLLAEKQALTKKIASLSHADLTITQLQLERDRLAETNASFDFTVRKLKDNEKILLDRIQSKDIHIHNLKEYRQHFLAQQRPIKNPIQANIVKDEKAPAQSYGFFNFFARLLEESEGEQDVAVVKTAAAANPT